MDEMDRGRKPPQKRPGLLVRLLAFLVTLTKDKGVWPAVIKFAVLAGYLVMNLILVGSLKVYDFIFLAFLVYLLFFKRFK